MGTNSNNNYNNITTLTNNNNQKKRKKKRHRFYVIHIGPSKTATSTIQWYSNWDPTFIEALQKDQVQYVGRIVGKPPPPNNNSTTNNNNSSAITTSSSVEDLEDPRRRRLKKEKRNRDNDPRRIYNNGIRCMRRIYKDWNNSNSNSIETAEEIEKNKLRQLFRNACWNSKESQDLLNNYNIIDSDEVYSSYFTNQDIRNQNSNGNGNEAIQEQNQNNNIIKNIQLFDLLGYHDEIIVIGAYRRYADWLPSTYKQKTKGSCLHDIHDYPIIKACPNIYDYLNEFISHNESYGSRNWYHNLDETLLSLDSNNSKINNNNSNKTIIKILNYFQSTKYDSIVQEFYCDALGEDRTPNACAAASANSIMYLDIIIAGQELGLIPKPTLNKTKSLLIEKYNCRSVYDEQLLRCVNSQKYKCNTDASSSGSNYQWCDALNTIIDDQVNNKITTTATTATMIWTWEKLEQYHKEVILKKKKKETYTTGTDSTSSSSLPLLCPSKDELQILLDKSLRFEELVMPTINNNNNNRNNNNQHSVLETESQQVQQHSNWFWNIMVKKKKTFCWIDIDKLFHNVSTWEQLLNERL
ncbi:hypothetical protein FRACYDRAFT_249361 [Fragilariopsis cylindrus CCMP1102]|uniref:Uncharacterized protein n=1 Tax=Fragilariopsis cylindrus CCMP1102 TaxID=635003 RepID=A0A1E7ET56_9STRA|nr:hypothetical protein FRACYDRAFT_249361 [Fragilariopsis cylindrus CCMP1102]|eukprot:OEU09017.1 hypothetical protein FRACYDRAFT_249361 [Fragilariopsis cylindrus CCMP1102]